MLRFNLSSNSDIKLSHLQIALIGFILAKQKNSNLIISIDDINQNEDNSFTQENLEILKKFAINSEQKIYRRDNLSIYQRFATKLIENKKAYLCFCNEKSCKNSCNKLSKIEIEKKLKDKLPYSIILKGTKSQIAFNDILNGKREAKCIEDFVILKGNTPTSIFANAIDDMVLGVTISIKDKAELENTYKEKYIYSLFGFNQNIEYIHIKCVEKAPTLKSLLLYGIIPDSIINYAIGLIYNFPKEIFYLPDAIEFFEVSKLVDSKEFDLRELKKLNQKHLKLMDSKKLSTIVGFADSEIGELLKVFLNSLYTINELEAKFKEIFNSIECEDSIKDIANIIKKAPALNSFKEFKEYLIKKSGLNEEQLNDMLVKLIGAKDISELESIYPFIKSYILEVAKCK